MRAFIFGGKQQVAQAWAKSFYRSSAWQAARHAALVRDCYTCQMCGARATEVHHKTELTPSNISDPMIALNQANLLSLCGDCHKQVTMEAHGRIVIDCDDGFFFDDDGHLS